MIDTCFVGDVRDGLRAFAAAGVRAQTCVTSPPYWGLRDYGMPGQLGLESTPAEYVLNMVDVFRLVRDLLADDGTLWLNLGDSYTSGGRTSRDPGQSKLHPAFDGNATAVTEWRAETPPGLKPKDLVGIPWRVAFALQADGWYLRSDIIWHKRAPMPESVTDRPTKAHEYLFLLAKSEHYLYDADAVKEPYEYGRDHHRNADIPPTSHVPGAPIHTGLRRSGNAQRKTGDERGRPGSHIGASIPWIEGPSGRNRRSVWTLNPEPYPEAHFAVMPTALVKPCILAGSRVGDVVLDPFLGSGTVAQVAQDLGRHWVGTEINPEYVRMQAKRTAQAGLALEVA